MPSVLAVSEGSTPASPGDLINTVNGTGFFSEEATLRHPDLTSKSPTGSYTWTSYLKNIRRDVLCSEKADTTVPTSISDKASLLSNLGYILALRYERFGDLGDLQKAIRSAEEALALTPCDDPARAGRLNNLSSWLGRRFERTGAMDDLEMAISQSKEAVQSTPRDHPCLARRLSSLGNWLARRYERTSSSQDLDQAIICVQDALGMIDFNHPNRAAYLTSLGNMLALRYKTSRNDLDLMLAIFFVEKAVSAMPADSPDRTNYLSNLGTIFAWKYDQTGSLDDLRDAILYTEEALEAMPDNHSSRAATLNSLGDLLYYRCSRELTTNTYGYRRTRDLVLLYYERSWGCGNAPPAVRIKAAYKAADILLGLRRWEQSSVLLDEAVRMLPRISSYNLKQRDQQHMLKEFAGLATLAASAALLGGKGPVRAIQLLELGRGVIARLRLGVGSDAPVWRMEHLETAQMFERSQKQHNPLRPSPSLSLAAEEGAGIQLLEARQRSTSSVRTRKVVGGICQLSGYENFLLSPVEHELRAAASSGPIVVINISPVRCDALVLKTDAVICLPLPSLRHKDVAQKAEHLKLIQCSTSLPLQVRTDMLSQVLEWLWDVVASPVLENLGFREPPAGGKWPRLWWIPTGLLSLFPIHAAGYHRSFSSETVIDRVVSSYSPSIKALLHAQKQPMGFDLVPKEVLLVSVEKAPGCPPLRKAKDEIGIVEQLLPAQALTTKLEDPCKGDVLVGLSYCDVFHFAGHSMPDPSDPSMSRLVLMDWQETPLTVEDLINVNRHDSHPFLAYLSACSTGTNSAECLHDESINLMTACQLAGFRHIVGSLWDVYDQYSTDAAREFYKALRHSEAIDDKAVAWGVHLAVRHIREMTSGGQIPVDEEDNPLAWAAYIHMGP